MSDLSREDLRSILEEALAERDKERDLAATPALTPEQWAEDSSVSRQTKQRRRLVVRMLSRYNGFESIESLLGAVKGHKLSLYTASKIVIDNLRQEGLKVASINEYKSCFPDFFERVLKVKIDRVDFNKLVGETSGEVTTSKASPSQDNFVRMLRVANAKDKVLLGMLASGFRVGEAISRKMSDLEIRPQGYARVTLKPSETKAKYKRYVFLTKELVDWIQAYHLTVKSDWVLPGEQMDHFSSSSALRRVKELFVTVGLHDTDTEIYSPHSLRTFADTAMSKAGLDRKYIEIICGHKSKLGATAAYIDPTDLETAWHAIEPQLSWISKTFEVVKEDTRLRTEFEAYKDKMERLVRGLLANLLRSDDPDRIERAMRILGEKSDPVSKTFEAMRQLPEAQVEPAPKE